jgi:flagellar hook assembly protein FlgD
VRVNAETAGIFYSIKIYNLTGEIIRKIEFTAAAPGWINQEWDLKNTAGKTVGQGIYFVRIEAEGAAVVRKVYIIK